VISRHATPRIAQQPMIRRIPPDHGRNEPGAPYMQTVDVPSNPIPHLPASTTFYLLRPVICGEVWEPALGSPARTAPRHHIDDWFGDGLVMVSDRLLVSSRTAARLAASTLTGFRLGDVTVSYSDDVVAQLSGVRPLPVFKRLEITGVPERDDLGLSFMGSPIASQSMMDILRLEPLQNCHIGVYSE
jgi:hypothetical protein